MSVILHKNKRLNRTESHLEKLAKEDTLSKSCGIPFTVGEVDYQHVNSSLYAGEYCKQGNIPARFIFHPFCHFCRRANSKQFIKITVLIKTECLFLNVSR